MKVHFMGIGGSGASAVAAISQAQGYQISGCDLKPVNEFTKSFDQNNLYKGHSPSHLEGIDMLIISPAIISLDSNNPELIEAKKKGIPILTWQEFMGKYLEKDKFVIAISGTHGKSTTTAMVGLLLEDAGLDPTVELGAIVPRWGSNFKVGKGKYFITEADEFNDNFLVSHPNIAVVTTIEMDHPEYFKDSAAYKNSFIKFLSQTKEKIIANLSDRGVKEVLALPSYKAIIIDYSKELINFPLQVPGEYNKFNASAVYQVGISLGIDPQIIKTSLAGFTGTRERFEYLGDYKEAKVYSDFGHHPTEIKVTLEAARQKFPDQKITVIFQPHMFSRTYALFDDFVKILKNLPVDEIIIMDIFPSREIDTGKVSSQQLVKAINKKSVSLVPTGDSVLEKVKQEAGQSDVLFFLGAGKTNELAKKLLS